MKWIGLLAVLLAACGGEGGADGADGAGGTGGVEQPEERCVEVPRAPGSDEIIRVCMPEGWPYGSVSWDAGEACSGDGRRAGFAIWWREIAGEHHEYNPPSVSYGCFVDRDCLAPSQIDAPECCTEVDPNGSFPIDCPAD